MIDKFQKLSRAYEDKKRALQRAAKKKRDWAVGLAFIPLVGAIASPILSSQSNSDMAAAAANQDQAETAVAKIALVKDTLLVALDKFILGLDSIAGFFNVMKSHLTSMQEKGTSSVDEPKKAHYLTMRSKARRCMALCQDFFRMAQKVDEDLQRISFTSEDRNLVRQRLAREKQEIKANFERKGKLNGAMKKLLADMEKAKNKL